MKTIVWASLLKAVVESETVVKLRVYWAEKSRQELRRREDEDILDIVRRGGNA